MGETGELLPASRDRIQCPKRRFLNKKQEDELGPKPNYFTVSSSVRISSINWVHYHCGTGLAVA
jgi:hypothetical protein